jgi:hypothetical protein
LSRAEVEYELLHPSLISCRFHSLQNTAATTATEKQWLQLALFDARPHWGKLFTMAPARLHSLYQKLPDFQRLLTSYDPQGKFRNPFLNTYIIGA